MFRIENRVIGRRIFPWRNFPAQKPSLFNPMRIHVRDKFIIVAAMPENMLMAVDHPGWFGLRLVIQ